MDGSEPRGSRSPGAGSGQEAASEAPGSGKPRGEHREAAGCRCGARVGASSGRKQSDGPKARRDRCCCCCCESSGSSAQSLRRQSKVNNSDQLDWSQSHEDLMTMIQEMKKCLPEDKRSSSKPSTISALNYALQCVQQVQANKEFFQALNDRRVFQTDVTTYSIEELVTVASEHTPKNSDTFVAVFSLLSGRIVHISKQAASILNCKKKVLDSSRFVELLAPQDVSVFYTHTDQSHLPLWNVENQTDSLFEYAQVKSFFCRLRGGKDQEQEKHCYPFRIIPYLVHVCTSVHIDAESCCLALAEKIHSGYEAPRIPMEKRIFTTTHTPGCVFLEIDDRAVPLLGYLPQDLIGTSMLMYLHPEDRPLMIAVHRKILKFAGQSPFEHLPIRFCTQNGDYVILDTSWSSFVNPWSRKVVFIIGRHKVRTSPLNEDVFAARNKEASSVEKEIRELQGQIYKLLLQPVHSSISSGYDSLGSSGSYEHYISISSSSDSNGNCADETQEPITLQQVCADVNRIKNLGQQLYIASWSKPQNGNEQAMSSEMLGGKRHSASCFLQRVRSDSTEEPGNILYDDSKRTPLVPSYQQINCVDSIIRYLESCSIPVLKRKCKSSTNTSSSSSDDDKKTQQTQQEFKALEVNSQTPVSADGEEMLKKQTTAGVVGAPLADLTLSKSPSVVSATSQCSYSSTIVHVPHPQSEVTTMEDAAVGNEQMELPPVNELIMVPEELKPVGLTKETLSAHTQKEEQNYVDKFHQRILLSPFRTYLQQGSRSNNGHSCGQGDSPSLERSTASCKKGKHGKIKCQKPQRQSLDSHSHSKNRNTCSLPREKRTIQKQSFFPSEVSCQSSSTMNVFPPVGFPVYSDPRSSFPASLVGEELALHSLKPEPTSLSQLSCEAPSFPALYPPNLGTFMAVFFHSYPMYSQLPQYAFLPSPQYIYPPSSYPCATLPLAPPPAPSAVAPNSVNQPFPASSATSTEEQQEGWHDWALQLSSSRGSSPLQLDLLQEELPKPVEPSINTDVKAQAEAKCDNDPEGGGNSTSSHCASSEFTDHQLHQDSQSGTGSALSGSGPALFSSLVLLVREGRPNTTFLACPGHQHGGPAKDYSSRHAAGHKSLPPLLRMLQPGPAAVPVFLRRVGAERRAATAHAPLPPACSTALFPAGGSRERAASAAPARLQWRCLASRGRAARPQIAPRARPPWPRRKRKPPAGGLGRSRSVHRDRGRGPAGAMVQLGSRLLKGYRGGHVVIRLALGGCTNRPFYRIVAAHSRRARDGKYLEQLGCLDPLPNARGEKVAGLNLERLRHWLGCGAQLSRPAEKLLGLAGFLPLHPMTVTGAERLRRRQRAQEAAVPTPAVGGSQEHGETA